eukprot:UN3679
MEFAEGGTLEQLLYYKRDLYADDSTELAWIRRAGWAAGIARGMQFLHSLLPRGLIHRDLKSANVLLSKDLCAAKVSDFGLSKTLVTMATRSSTRSMKGTLGFAAPETFKARYSEKSDMFSFAVTCYEIVARCRPFDGLDEPEITDKLRARFEVNQRSVQRGISEEVQRQEWNEDHPLDDRRPDLSLVHPGCPLPLLD